MISIHGMLKMTQGQGQKVKGQGQTWSYEKNVVALVTHERMIES